MGHEAGSKLGNHRKSCRGIPCTKDGNVTLKPSRYVMSEGEDTGSKPILGPGDCHDRWAYVVCRSILEIHLGVSRGSFRGDSPTLDDVEI